jgi:hypothetical protein
MKKEEVLSKIDDQLIKTIFEKNNISNINTIQEIKQGVANPVFIVSGNDEDYIIRFLNPIASDWKPEKEKIIYSLLKKNNVNVPEIINIDISK